MAEIPAEVKNILDQYIRVLEDNNIHICKAFLFGSYATQRTDKWSDIDIALVSDDFEGIRFRDKEKIRKTTLALSPLLSPLPFRTLDFTDDDPFVRHIRETGLSVK